MEKEPVSGVVEVGEDSSIDRRQMFGRIAAIVGGAIAVTALPSQAIAADDAPVLVGNQATGTSGAPAIHGYNSATGPGVRGSAANNHGVLGYTYEPGKAGVYGSRDSTSGYGVHGVVTNGTGVVGESDFGGGVSGYSHTAGYQGVYGLSDAESGFGVYGRATKTGAIGVQGVSWQGKGVYGQSEDSYGVHGKSDAGEGVYGETSAAGKAAVYGVSAAGLGVKGASTSNDGISGASAGEAKSGVNGTSTHAKGFGVRGRADASTARGMYGQSTAGVGVYGVSTKGTGVYAKAGSAGRALAVSGKAKFSRSGLRTIRSGSKTARVTVAGGLTSASKMLITAQGSPGTGVYVKYAKYYDATHFTIVLNKAATRTFKVAWMVID